MAIEHLKVKIFSRAKGHSALAKAAYRSGEALHDEQSGVTWNFTRKRHVDTTFILAPPGAPSWALSRETLWNRVEAHETRRNAQLARELEISLPRELTHAQQEALVRSFLREHFVSQGMVADCAIHRPPARTASKSEPSTDNPHAHVMLTMRALTPDGFGTKRRDWNDVDLKSGTRRLWEEAANVALARAGRLERIDMRSFVDRGVDLVPQPPRGRSPAEVSLDGRSRVHEQHRRALRIARENGERILARPDLVLELLSTRQSTFSEHDLLRALGRYTADADQFIRARLRVLASHELVVMPSDHGPPRYTTRATVAAERSVLASANTLARRAGHPVRTGRIEAALETSARALSDEQAAAVRHLATSCDLALVEGYAGAGKSTMLAAARAAWTSEGYDVVGAALAGKAAEGLSDRGSAGIPARTIAAWEWAWAHGRDALTARHVLVIDEAGMVGTRQLERILRTARDAGAKVVLVGDTRQLQAIEPGAPMRLLANEFGASRLTRVIRQGDHVWQAAATKLFGDGRPKEALEAYVAAGRVHALRDAESAQRALVARWARDRADSPTDTTLLLAYRRAEVAALNALARAVRRDAGELGTDHEFETSRGVRRFAESDRIYFLKNDKRLGVTNGTLATIEAIAGRALVVRLDDHRQVTVDTTTYAELDHGYAATVHKAQGVTVDRAYVLGSKYLDAAASYVALSRHRKDVDLFYSAREFDSPKTLVEKLARDRTQPMALEERAPRQAPAALAVREKAEQAFLALTPEAQLAQLDALKRAGERPLRSAAEVLELLPEVKAATAAYRDAEARVALAEQAVGDYRAEHPLAYELGFGRAGALEDALSERRDALTRAEAALARTRNSPERRARAQRTATRHNLAVKHARERWTLYHDLRRRTERDAAIARYAAAANRQRGDRAFRAADPSDEGKPFKVLLKRAVRGEPVFVLRGQDGALVIADARLFATEPALGTSAVLTGLNAQSRTEAPTKGRRHGIDRSSDIDFD